MDLQRFFQKDTLTPIIIQDCNSKEVLMLGYTNEEALRFTLKTGTAWFWSRSRSQLWNKGETSKNFLHVQEIRYDCDEDTLLYLCRPDGPTCHTEERSCFYRILEEENP
jgi:Phosphoribosyl-AMP cyclohydrolase